MADLDLIFGYVWWGVMIFISLVNLLCLIPLWRAKFVTTYETYLRRFATIFTVVCAYRSIWPRIDVERICFWDTPLNWVIFGRAAATVAELCWIAQISWCIIQLCEDLEMNRNTCYKINIVSKVVVVMGFMAECCSWTCLSTTDHLFCMCEESLWTIMFFFSAISAWMILQEIRKTAVSTVFSKQVLWLLFIFLVAFFIAQILQVFLYATRFVDDTRNHVHYMNPKDGIKDMEQCKKTTRKISDWWKDALWMTPYFSFCVWQSLWLGWAPRFKQEYTTLDA